MELPGADPIEVGSGSHRWVVSYSRDPQPSGSVSTQTSLAALIDDAEAYEAVWRAMADVDPKQASTFRKRTKWVEERALSGTFIFTPPAVVARIEAALDDLSRRRTR